VARDGEPQFGLLETIREYALERLRNAGDWKQAHDRHAAYFMALAEPAESEQHDPGQLAWLGRLESGAPGLGDLAVLVAARTRCRTRRPREGDRCRSGRLPPLQRAMALALTGTGFTFTVSGDLARAQTLFEQSVSLYGQVEEELGAVMKATVMGILGHLAGLRGDYAAASQLLENSQAALQEVSDGELAGYERLSTS
jgi:hypothetical protein